MPIIDGKVHHFSAGGLYNGLSLLIDDETHTYWDHITGEAVHGPLHGQQLDNWPITHTNVGEALANDLDISVNVSSHRSLLSKILSWALWRRGKKQGFLPPHFQSTMTEPDERLSKLELGLGVVDQGRAVYYPLADLTAGIDDEWVAGTLNISRGDLGGSPVAIWKNSGERPFQLLSRWYGFAYTYPGCEIYKP